MLNLTFTVTDAAKVAAILAIMQGPDGGAAIEPPPQPAVEKKTRAKKEEAPAADPFEGAPAEAKKPTPAEIRTAITEKIVAMRSKNDPKDMEKFAAALAKVGAAKFSAIKDDDLLTFEKELFG